MLPNVERCVALAEHARQDSSLVPNHMPYVRDVLIKERDELRELVRIYEGVNDIPDDIEFLQSLRDDLKLVEAAVDVYPTEWKAANWKPPFITDDGNYDVEAVAAMHKAT